MIDLDALEKRAAGDDAAEAYDTDTRGFVRLKPIPRFVSVRPSELRELLRLARPGAQTQAFALGGAEAQAKKAIAARDQEWREALMRWSGGSALNMADEFSAPLRKLMEEK